MSMKNEWSHQEALHAHRAGELYADAKEHDLVTKRDPLDAHTACKVTVPSSSWADGKPEIEQTLKCIFMITCSKTSFTLKKCNRNSTEK